MPSGCAAAGVEEVLRSALAVVAVAHEQFGEPVLVADVVQKPRLGDADGVGHFLQRQAVEAVAGHEPGGGLDDLLAPLLRGQADALTYCD